MTGTQRRRTTPTPDVPGTTYPARGERAPAVAYRYLDSPLGPLLLAGTPVGLLRVAFAVEGFETVLGELAQSLGVSPFESGPRLGTTHALDEAAFAIDGYFGGDINAIEVPLDLRLLGGFARSVADHLPTIGYGRTASYAEVASAIGQPTDIEAVGSACLSNPLPIVLPCHRVVPTSGSLGQYVGGPEAKRVLLALEVA